MLNEDSGRFAKYEAELIKMSIFGRYILPLKRPVLAINCKRPRVSRIIQDAMC